MAANTQMPPLSSPNTCTAQAEEAQHRGSGIWKTRLSAEVGTKEDTDVCSTAILTAVQHGLPSPALKPCFLVGLASQSGHQLLGTMGRDSWWHWHKALGVSSSPLAPCNSPAWSGAQLGQEVTQSKWSVHPLAGRIIKHFDLALDWGKEYFGSISEKAGNYL